MNFFRLSIASVDGKQNLSEVVYSALVGFLLLQKYPTFGRKKPYQQNKEPGEPQESGFSSKSQNQVRGMCWSIVVMEAPIAC